MAGKGDKRRPGDDKKFRNNWERIFGKKESINMEICPAGRQKIIKDK
jgi:hypothetical protein